MCWYTHNVNRKWNAVNGNEKEIKWKRHDPQKESNEWNTNKTWKRRWIESEQEMNGNWVRNKRKGNRKFLLLLRKIRSLKSWTNFFTTPFIKYFREWAPTLYVVPIYSLLNIPTTAMFFEEKTLPRKAPSKFVSENFRGMCAVHQPPVIWKKPLLLWSWRPERRRSDTGCPFCLATCRAGISKLPLCFHFIGDVVRFIYPIVGCIYTQK